MFKIKISESLILRNFVLYINEIDVLFIVSLSNQMSDDVTNDLYFNFKILFHKGLQSI